MTELALELGGWFFVASYCLRRLHPEIRLCMLDKSGPCIDPKDLPETWSGAKKYIKVHGRAGDPHPAKDLYRWPGGGEVELHLTLCLESDVELPDRALKYTNRYIAKSFHPSLEKAAPMELWPASTYEVEAPTLEDKGNRSRGTTASLERRGGGRRG